MELIILGSGTIRRMLEAGITYHDIDYIFYTHIHPDHVSDLVPFIFTSKYAEQPRRTKRPSGEFKQVT